SDRAAPRPLRARDPLRPRTGGHAAERGAGRIPRPPLRDVGERRPAASPPGPARGRGRGRGSPRRWLSEPSRFPGGDAAPPVARGLHPLPGGGGRSPLPHRPPPHPVARVGRAGRCCGRGPGRVRRLRRPRRTGCGGGAGDPARARQADDRRPALRARGAQPRPAPRRARPHPQRGAALPRGDLVIEAIRNLLEGEVGRSFGAAQACVFAGGALVHESAHGGHGGLRTDARTLFDVSSLTKVVATTTLVYRMASRGELSFDDVVGRWFPEAASRDVPLRALLGHRSGLPAWAPLFVAPQGVLAAALGVAPEVPVGARRLYGDINFILLGAVLERIANRPLDRLFADEVAAPLGLRHTAFRRIPARMPLEG